MKKTCTECGKEVEKSFKFCPYCFSDFAVEEEEEELGVIDEISALDEDETDQDETADSEEEEESGPLTTENGEPLILGKYIILEPLFCGVSGTICLVRDYIEKDDYIMKDFILNRRRDIETVRERLEELFGTIRKFRHPHISPVLHSRIRDDVAYLIYEYKKGVGFDKYLAERFALGNFPSVGEIRNWILQLLSIVRYLHGEKQFRCGNLLPYSLVIDKETENLWYVNAGLPQIYRTASLKDPFEKEPLHPERLDRRNYDFYCIGLCLLFCLTGKKTVPGGPAPQVDPASVPQELQPILERLLGIMDETEEADADVLESLLADLPEQESEPNEEPAAPERESWNIYLGNQGRTNSLNEGPVPPLFLAWSIVIPAALQFYLIPWGNVLVVISDKGVIYELDNEKSTIIRKNNLNISAVPPIEDRGVLYINSSSNQTAVDLSNLEPKWDFRTKSMFLSSPCLIEGKLCTVSYDGYMMFIDIDEGKPASMEDIGAKVMSASSYDSRRIYIPSLAGNLMAISLESRIVEWAVNLEASITAAPAMYEKTIFAGASNGKLCAINSEDGTVLWSHRMNGAISKSPKYIAGKVLCATTHGELSCYGAENGEKIWSVDMGCKHESLFCITETLVYALGPEQSLLTIDLKNGRICDKINFKKKINSVPLAADNKLYLSTVDGEIFALAARKYE